MRGREAQEILRKSLQAAADRGRGVQTPITRTSGIRMAEITVGDLDRLPALANDVPLQASNGNIYFTPGYSAVGGPHVLR